MADYSTFRQQLDNVLRTQDVKQVQAFLIVHKQWHLGQPADPEFAMWMMIAGSQTLRDLHEEAREKKWTP
jgi:vancomycin permeability regulator SanA